MFVNIQYVYPYILAMNEKKVKKNNYNPDNWNISVEPPSIRVSSFTNQIPVTNPEELCADIFLGGHLILGSRIDSTVVKLHN